MITSAPLPKPTLNRLPTYLNYLKTQKQSGVANVSATTMANALGLNHVQVRKDLSMVSNGGKPKVGYDTEGLMNDIMSFLGYDNSKDVALIGVGRLGTALLAYNGFSEYGLDITVAFDTNPSLHGNEINGIKVLPVEKAANICERLKIHIAILAVPADNAQQAADALIKGGVKAILNFAPAHIVVPNDVVLRNENIAAQLAILSKTFEEKKNIGQINDISGGDYNG